MIVPNVRLSGGSLLKMTEHICIGVGEGWAGEATAPSLLKGEGEGEGGTAQPLHFFSSLYCCMQVIILQYRSFYYW